MSQLIAAVSPGSRAARRLIRPLVATLAASGLLLAGACSGGEEPAPGAPESSAGAEHGDTRTITDILGREVTVPATVEHAALGSQRMLYTTAVLNPDEPLDGIAAWPDDMKRNDPEAYNKYREKFPEIEDIATIGKIEDIDPEELLGLEPDVFVVSADKFDSAEEAGLVGTLEKAGVATVAIDFFLDPVNHTVPSIELMGELFGQEDNAERFVDFYEAKKSAVADRLKEEKPEPVDTFLWRAAGNGDCCGTFSDSNLSQIVNFVGGHNIGDDLLPDINAGEVSPEAVVDANPEVLLLTGANWGPANSEFKEGSYVPLGYDEPADKAKEDLKSAIDNQPGIKELDAVKEGRAFAAWHHFYNSPYNFLAMEWFAKAIHPELFADLDPQADFEELHEEFLPIEAEGTFWTGLS
ncbi:ABC transporter substrate-binding protein [Corynebacterium otitidis]|uniref:Fe/B12 periplasmic-binding domain-containing protein n=1 Tax=Corynebacterium otitidis ATCC 51513 TaxID=883169 RepID=I7IWL7_9CORY|nr:ABC transporter substrate-binding protein [Corynebacterium otitidis]EJZ82874.1 hypothetical protein HMPREF9719_00197 [Corynebacterium otitidis ATCC 51513]CCI83063.1 hypothetical protein BN46_0315 [Corynebacterium otitidis ATCC 51513]